jgi:DNA-binding XRE family transcriptional regulator
MSVNDKNSQYKAFGDRIKFLREQWQQTLRDVCYTLEIDEKTLRALESGKMAPSPDLMDMIISHFLLTEDQAQDLRDLIDDGKDIDLGVPSSVEDMLAKQLVMFMPLDNKVIYTDSMQATVNDNGVVLQFMQQTGNNQPVAVSRVGMSRMHAERVIKVLQDTLKQHDQHNQKKLSSPGDQQSN